LSGSIKFPRLRRELRCCRDRLFNILNFNPFSDYPGRGFFLFAKMLTKFGLQNIFGLGKRYDAVGQMASDDNQ